MAEKLCDTLRQLDEVVVRFDDVVGSKADTIRNECKILPAEKLEKQLEEFDAENRLLTIGIVGPVKAGKSSLLNAVFFNGKSVLPKAATPMTASLSVMTYGETFCAEVEYYSPADIDIIKQEHGIFEREKEKVYAEKKKAAEERAQKKGIAVDMEKVERMTRQEMQNHPKAASYDQYERMRNSGRLGQMTANSKVSEKLSASSLRDLMNSLGDYVGADGSLMPFTKSVCVYLPMEELKDVQIVDTPGLNDPVKSREKRTEEYLGSCDVVFIISPAGHFLSDEDIGLMTHISAKEGVHELYLVASQADNQLYGNEKEENDGVFYSVVSSVRQHLAEQASDVLRNLKTGRPDIGKEFDQLIQDGTNRVMITSSICHAMARLNQTEWDADMNHVWELLSENYPDYFTRAESAKDNLNNLSGIESIKEKIADARSQKDRIISEKQQNYLNGQAKNIEEYRSRLISAVKEKKEQLESTDAKQLLDKKNNMEKVRERGSKTVDMSFADSLDEFIRKMERRINEQGKGLISTAGSDVNASMESKTEKVTRTKTVKREGLKGFFGRIFGNDDWGYKEEEYTVDEEYTIIRVAAVKNKLKCLIHSLEDAVDEAGKDELAEWKKRLPRCVTSDLREAVQDDTLIDDTQLVWALRKVIQSLNLPDFSISSYEYNGNYSGSLKNDEADAFLDDVQSYLTELRVQYRNQISEYVAELRRSAGRESISSMLFGNITDELENIEREIENKEETINRLDACLEQLNAIA